ncbi:MAG: HD domain-containing protein, partial [Actinobacteria bacterium]|nr:HD domain-containing protein [Actinomycetota bacterium]
MSLSRSGPPLRHVGIGRNWPEQLRSRPLNAPTPYSCQVRDLTYGYSARGEAARLLGTSSDRWDHVVGVVTAARAVVDVLPVEDTDLLVAAAWLHDIGYSPAIADTGFHPLDGARHLRSLGAPARLCALVAHHSAAAVEARVRHMRAMLLAEFPPEESIVADALTFADMT